MEAAGVELDKGSENFEICEFPRKIVLKTRKALKNWYNPKFPPAQQIIDECLRSRRSARLGAVHATRLLRRRRNHLHLKHWAFCTIPASSRPTKHSANFTGILAQNTRRRHRSRPDSRHNLRVTTAHWILDTST